MIIINKLVYRKYLLYLLTLVVALTTVSCANQQMKEGVTCYRAKKYQKAFDIFSRLADKGHVKARFNIGVMYYYGQGVKQNYKEAFKHFIIAAEDHMPMSEYIAGQMYIKGVGVKRNPTKGVKLMLSSAKHGCLRSQLQLGVMYAKLLKMKQAKQYFKIAETNGASSTVVTICYKYAEKWRTNHQDAEEYIQHQCLLNPTIKEYLNK